MNERNFFGLSPHEWVGVFLGAAFLFPIAFFMIDKGVFAQTGTDSYASSTQDTQLPMPLPNPGPVKLTATPGGCSSNTIYLSWTRGDDMYRYRLYRNANKIYEGTQIAYADRNLIAGMSYSYRLVAFIPEFSTSSGSAEDSVIMPAPANCTSQDSTTTGGTNVDAGTQSTTTETTNTNGSGTYGTISTTTGVTNTIYYSTTTGISNTADVATVSRSPLPIIPSSTYLRVGQELQFFIPEYARTGSVRWRIQEGVEGGSISGSGVYRAPLTPGTYHIGAFIDGSSYGPGLAVVRVEPPVPVIQSADGNTVSTPTGASSPTDTTVSSPSQGSTYVRDTAPSTPSDETEREKPSVVLPVIRDYERRTVETDQETQPPLPRLSETLRIEAKKIVTVAELIDQKDAARAQARIRILETFDTHLEGAGPLDEEARTELERIRSRIEKLLADDGASSPTKEVLIQELDEAPIALDTVAVEAETALETLQTELSARDEALKEAGGDLLYTDSNDDGISDYESERIYGLDPKKPSPKSLYRGTYIGAEEKLLLGFDPASEKLVSVTPEEPTEAEVEATSAYKVQNVALSEEKKLSLSGRALPNSFITLFVYSTPVVVTVKTDAEGEWSYTFDKELADGTHTVYTATVNNSGKILARSQGYLFTKTAQAATLDSVLPETTVVTADAKPRFLVLDTIVFIVGAVALFLFIVLLVVGRRPVTSGPDSLPPA